MRSTLNRPETRTARAKTSELTQEMHVQIREPRQHELVGPIDHRNVPTHRRWLAQPVLDMDNPLAFVTIVCSVRGGSPGIASKVPA